jgi:DNA-binding CsgD family transcriptional regulator
MSNVFPYYKDIDELVLTLIEIGLITVMIRIFLGFQENDISPRFKGWVGAVVMILVLSYGIKMIMSHTSPFFRWFDTVLAAIFSNLIILEFPILIGLLIVGKKGENRDKTRIIQSFAVLYLSRWILVLIFIFFVFAFEIPDSLRLLTTAFSYFLFNLVPLIWIRYYFLEYANCILKNVEERAVLATIFKKHNITQREQDIVKLLLEGKSNREIADSLFIAIPTVKNHIRSLYQKLRVKTRYELIHFILNY